MTLVIAVAQQKGGAGKTMLVANLAAAFAATRRVAVLDIDKQHSLARWHALRVARANPPAALTLSDAAGWRLSGELDRLRRDHDVLLIDSPPQVDTDARLAVRAAALVLVPVQPSPPDLWAAEDTLAMARAERRMARLVLNRAPATSRLRTAMEAAIAATGHTLLTATLGNRAAFAAAFAVGLGVVEHAPNGAAAIEMRALAEEVAALAEAPTSAR